MATVYPKASAIAATGLFAGLNSFAALEERISALPEEKQREALELPVSALWEMRNGYALCSQDGLDAISGHLAKLNPDQTDALRAKLCIGLHSDVEVTDTNGNHRPRVSQAFCSALPVDYTCVPSIHWAAFASLVLEGAYEATMWAAVWANRYHETRVRNGMCDHWCFGRGISKPNQYLNHTFKSPPPADHQTRRNSNVERINKVSFPGMSA